MRLIDLPGAKVLAHNLARNLTRRPLALGPAIDLAPAVRPLRHPEPSRLETMPSSPSRSAEATTSGPAPAMPSLNSSSDFGELGSKRQRLSTLLEGRAAQIPVVEEEKVEGDEEEAAAAAADRPPHGAKSERPRSSRAMTSPDHCRATAQLAGSLDDRAVVVRPVEPVPGERARCGAKAIIQSSSPSDTVLTAWRR
jgi:hypothetical protein